MRCFVDVTSTHQVQTLCLPLRSVPSVSVDREKMSRVCLPHHNPYTDRAYRLDREETLGTVCGGPA